MLSINLVMYLCALIFMLTFKHKENSALVFQLLECGGNLFDVASIAVKAALYNTKYLYLIYFSYMK